MKKRVVAINALPFGSTGKIMQGIAHEAARNGYDVDMYVATGVKTSYTDGRIFNINTSLGNKIAIALSKLTGLEGCFAFFPTLKLIKTINVISPDIIHLHILHHGYVNLPILFYYLKKKSIPIIWTLHDCWAFTGHCPHFSYEKCEKWKKGCFDCPRYCHYPRSLYDNSRFMWRWKKRWFSGLSHLTLVAPSKWLAGFIKDSYLKDYPLFVVHNGIDLNVFKPTTSDVRKTYGIDDRKIVLGVASTWSVRKGLDIFVKLSERLPEEYQIVLVGTDDLVDTQLPNSIISIHRTENQKELVDLYSAANVFVNPTREDNYPTVNMEALACGTPVITFRTGGSPESIDDTCGKVVECDDIDSLEKEIIRICDSVVYTSQNCRKRADDFDSNKRYKDYVSLYDRVTLNQI